MRIVRADPLVPNSSEAEHLSHRSQATKHYSYFLKQLQDTLSLANYVLSHLFEDNFDEWLQIVADRSGGDDEDAEGQKCQLREALAQIERSRAFNAIILCQIYNAFDIYSERLLRTVGSGPYFKGPMSSLDYHRVEFGRLGLDFLVADNDYDRCVLIRDCRNQITHNGGIVDRRFHARHPSVSDGVETRLRVYTEELSEYMDFLAATSYRLDGEACAKFGLARKTISDWTGPFISDDELVA